MKNTRFINTRLVLILLSIFSFCISSQSYSAVIYIDDNRWTDSSWGDGGSTGGTIVYTPDAPFADFNVYSQTSSLTPTGFSASGSSSGYTDMQIGEWRTRTSSFDIDFTLTAKSTISLTGMLSGLDTDGWTYVDIWKNDSVSSVRFYTNTLPSNDTFNLVESDLSFESILSAGSYRLAAYTNSSPHGTRADPREHFYSLEARFTPVPLPASVWLFGFGLFTLLGLGRKKGMDLRLLNLFIGAQHYSMRL